MSIKKKNKKNILREMFRRVLQIIVGNFVFDCPGLQNVRMRVYKMIFRNIGIENVWSSKVMLYTPHGLPLDVNKIHIGDYVRISKNVSVDCASPVSIGDNTWISQGVEILNHVHHIGNAWKQSDDIAVTSGLEILEDAWIGVNAIILPQVTRIGKGAIIGAGSVVTKNVEDYVVVAGNPAKYISTR